jgi:Flp pilus assembly protein TadD
MSPLAVWLAGCAAQGPPQLSTASPSDNVARSALADGAPEVALNVTANILATHPADEQALLIRADAFAMLGRPQDADASYRQVLARDPGSDAALRGLGRLLLNSDPAAAEALFQQAVARDPRDAAAFNNLGIARDMQGRHADAQIAYREALAVSPDMAAATANLALSLSLSGHAAEGLQLLKPLALPANAPSKLRYDYAAVATMAGDRQEAAGALRNDLTPDKLRDALDGFAALAAP